MSFYRTFIAAVAAMGLASAVFADEASSSAASTSATQTPAASSSSTTSSAPAAVAPTKLADATPAATTAEPSATDAAAPAADASKVNVNKATAKDLAQVKGMSATKAKAVVAYRKKHGDFKSLDELKEVKGFKKMDEKTMKDIQDQLTVG